MNFRNYSLDTLTSMRNKLIDRFSNGFYQELDKYNDSLPSEALIEVMNEYKAISDEIERRKSTVRKFGNIIGSGKSVKDYYDTLGKFTRSLEHDDWYDVHHNYRMSY